MIAGDKDEIRMMYGGISDVHNAQICYFSLGNYYDNPFTYKCLNTFTNRSIINRICYKHMSNGYKKQLDKLNFVAQDENVIFLIMARIYEKFGDSLTEYLRNAFPRCKLYCYLADIISSFNVSIEKFKACFDRVYTFDYKEAEKFSISFCQEPFEYVDVEDNPNIEECDISFIGKAKDRYDYLINLYEYFKKKNLNIKFFIYGVESDKQKYKDEIIYNYYMPFKELLQRVKKSKTILEIIQGEGSSPTTRYQEAMLYGKNLLTDCIGFDGIHYHLDNNIQIIKDFEKIDIDFIRSHHSFDVQKYMKMFSNETYINTIRTLNF